MNGVWILMERNEAKLNHKKNDLVKRREQRRAQIEFNMLFKSGNRVMIETLKHCGNSREFTNKHRKSRLLIDRLEFVSVLWLFGEKKSD